MNRARGPGAARSASRRGPSFGAHPVGSFRLLMLVIVAPFTTSVGAQAHLNVSETADLSVRKAVDFLWSKQQRDGQWISEDFEEHVPRGLTALTAFALRYAGSNDHRLELAAKSLDDRTMMRTIHARSFTLMLWCALDPERYRREIEEDIRFLTSQQHPDGAWGHGLRAGRGPDVDWKDNLNTQLALLALSHADLAGFDVSAGVWRRAEQSWLASQDEDGGWGYPLVEGHAASNVLRDSYGTPTAAGVASLHLIHDRIYAEAELPFNGRGAGRCGQDHERTRPIRAAIARGERWLDGHFRADAVPGAPSPSGATFDEDWWTNHLFNVTRAGIASGRKRFAGKDWHRAVAGELIARQAADGSWGNVQQTALGLLALIQSRTPLVIGKLRYGGGTDWNNDPRDAANLAGWYGRQTGSRVTWQTVDLATRAEDVFDAPVLLMTGHDTPDIPDAAHELLRAYVGSGGTILGVACCSRTEFANGFTALMESLFPRLEGAALPDDHPVWHMDAPVEPAADLIGMSDGCRTPILLHTASACCAWHQNRPDRDPRLFALGANVLAYATHGRPPIDRLTPPRPSDAPTSIGTIRVARVRHGGDAWADPGSIRALSARLARTAGLALEDISESQGRSAVDRDADLAWLVGHSFVELDRADRVALKSYLVNGGTMFASACCGRRDFDASFGPWARALFGEDRWVQVPPDDPLMTGAFAPGVASSLHGLEYKPARDGSSPARLDWPLLYGVRHNERWMIVYSPYDVSCGVAGHPCVRCTGYIPRHAEAIAANVMLYAASHRER